MKYIILALLAGFLLLGCMGGGEGPAADGGPDIKDIVPIPGDGGLLCNPEYTFSEINDGVFGKVTKLAATAACAEGERLEVTLDGKAVGGMTIGEGETDVELGIPGASDGTLELAVTSGGETIYSTDWEVAPLGNRDVSGSEYDGASFKEWRAMAFDIEGPANLGTVSIYMKLLEGRTQPNTNLMVELRKDDDGPGDIVDSVSIPITEASMSYNWIDFDFDSPVKLSKGRYWVAVMVEQTENIKVVSDVVMVHYIIIDKTEDGNDYTKRMKLSVDEITGEASPTVWEELPYDREYNIVLKG